MERRFRMNTGKVVFENYEAESLAINLDTGTYYSLPGASSRLWSMLARGAAPAQIANWFAQAHEGDRDRIDQAVADFLARLENEQLIVAEPGASTGAADIDAAPSRRTPFEGFEMRVFTDMQDMLLLDPIHDVDEAGWPNAPA